MVDARWAGWLLVGLGAALLGCASDGAAPPSEPADPRAGTWHVYRGFVRDPQGRAVIMRGVNFAGGHKTKPWFGPETADDARRIRVDLSMNAVRFLVSWAALEPSRGVYDAAYLEKVRERVGWMEAQGILVVLDMHQDLYGEGFAAFGGDGAPSWTCDEAHYKAFVPASPWFLSYSDPHMIACYDGFWNDTRPDGLQAHYVEAWRRLAQHLRGSSAVVGLDPMNEPYWGSAKSDFETGKLLPLYAKVVAAVRAEAPQWIAFAEPSAAHNLGLGTRIESFPFGDVAFSPHAYDSSAESGKGFNPAGHDTFAGTIASFGEEATAFGAALWIGEYGGPPNAGIASYMDAAYAGAGQVAASQMYWAWDRNDTGYGLLMADGTEKKAITDVVVRPYPARVAGDPIDYAFDATSRRFVTHWTADARVTAPTEIAIPARTYPGGYTVTCEGCTHAPTEGGLRVTATPAGKVTLVLTPR